MTFTFWANTGFWIQVLRAVFWSDFSSPPGWILTTNLSNILQYSAPTLKINCYKTTDAIYMKLHTYLKRINSYYMTSSLCIKYCYLRLNFCIFDRQHENCQLFGTQAYMYVTDEWRHRDLQCSKFTLFSLKIHDILMAKTMTFTYFRDQKKTLWKSMLNT